MGPRNHVLDGGPDPPMGSGNFEGGPLQSIGTQFTAESPYTLQWVPSSLVGRMCQTTCRRKYR